MVWQKEAFWLKVEHVKAHRTKKEQKQMSQFERFVTEGTEKAVELARQKQEQCWTKDLWQKQEQKLCSRRERGGVCSIAVCSQLPLPGRTMEGL